MKRIILAMLMVLISSSIYAANYEVTTRGNNVGIGSPSPRAVLDVQGTIAPIAATVLQGVWSQTDVPLVGSTANAVMVGNYTNLVTSGTGSLTGAGHTISGLSYNYHNGSGTLGLQIGAEGVIQNNSTGTVSNGAMVAGNMNNMATGATYTLLAGFQSQISNIATGTTITTLADYYSPDFSAVSNIPSNRFALFNIDTGKKIYTAGNIGLGDLTPAEKLVINGGNLRMTGGNIGIGISPTLANLQISGNSLPIRIEGAGTTGYNAIQYVGDSQTFRTGVAGSAEAIFGIQGKYFIYDENKGTIPFVISPVSNNVGIGSVNPGKKLDVQGTVRIISSQVGTPTLDIQGTLRRFLDTNNTTCTCCTTAAGAQTCTACSCTI